MLVSFVIGIVTGTFFLVGGRGSERFTRAAPEPAFVDTSKTADVPAAVKPPPSISAAPPPSVAAAVETLRDRDLLVPVQGVTREMLRDSFAETRDKIREHEAIDILAPRRTPALAVEDGTIVKFFNSERGGLTIYQFDPSQTYAYYYAHLDGYAPGLSEGDHVRRGQTIGFVGTSGNAPENTPHLHFQIFLLTEKKQWWQGTAINPYDVWKK
jgi:murein DD-endopeptidase MepM/ murein hydrolase activator NlpD